MKCHEPEEDTLREGNISQENYCDSNNLCTPTVVFAQVYDKIFSQLKKYANYWSHLEMVLNNHKDSRTNVPLKIQRYIVYIAYKWRDRKRARTLKYCNINNFSCDYIQAELDIESFNRPFNICPIVIPASDEKGRLLQAS